MKMKPSGHDRPVRSHALIQTVGLLILAIICIALFAAGSVYLMQLLSSHGVMELKSDTAGAFFNVYANSVGLAIAFLAGLSTIILALQAIRVSMHQTRLSAREAFNDELAEFREQIGAADQMLHDIAAKSLRYAQEVSAHMKNNYHPTLASPPEEVEPVELVLSDERQEWLDGKLDELSVLNADIVDELFVARLCDDAGSAENDDPGRVYAPDDRSISLTAIAGGMAKQSQSHKAVLKLSEGARFSTLIELLTRLVDTRDIRAALVDYLIDGGVERRFALQLADNYAKLFQRRQLRIESKPRPAHQPAA